jgi:hypothetical protein
MKILADAPGYPGGDFRGFLQSPHANTGTASNTKGHEEFRLLGYGAV